MQKRSKRTERLLRRQREIDDMLAAEGRAVLNDLAYASQSTIHGAGVFARRRIPRGSRIIEYVGEKISKAEARQRARLDSTVYLFSLNQRVDIDGIVGGNGAHLINHSCAPNARSEWSENRVFIIASRTIHPGDEITYNYGFDEADYEKYPCRCGADACRGYMVSSEAWSKIRRRATVN